MRTRIKAALAGNLKRGEGQQEFTKTVDAEFDRAGRSRLKSHQIANIYETNTATAFAAGQMARMIEVQEDFPFWKFSAIMDSHTSPEHAALHGKIFRNGDFTFYPPLRHRCRCTAILLTARQAGKFPKSDMPAADERGALYEKAGNPEFAGNKQGNYIKWLEHEYKDAEPATRKLIDAATTTMRQEMKELAKYTPETVQSGRIPALLGSDAEFVGGAKIRYKKEFFKLLNPNKPLKLVVEHDDAKQSSYHPADKSVHLVFASRAKKSAWYRERIVYHEFGHAIDWQRDIHKSAKMQQMLSVWQAKLRKPGRSGRPQIAEVHDRLMALVIKFKTMPEKTFRRRGITRQDATEQIGATLDTIMAINPKYGKGHKPDYYKAPGLREAEFLAHCFENKYAGNKVFEKFLPELYRQTQQCIDDLE